MKKNNNFCSYKDYKRELRKPLEEKVEDTKDIVAERLGQFGYNCYVAWSGGKDSTLVLWFALKYLPDVPVVFNNTTNEHPETVEFVHRIADQWGLNFIEKKPNMNFWQVVEKWGWPQIRAYSTRRHKRNTVLGDGHSHGDTPKCCLYLKEYPMNEVIKEQEYEATMTGLTGYESMQRRLLFIRYGYCYSTDRGLPWRMQKIAPIWHWTPKDVWNYIKSRNLPYNPIYDKGVERCGCMACTGHLNWQQEIAKTNPGLLRMMMKKMGQETLV